MVFFLGRICLSLHCQRCRQLGNQYDYALTASSALSPFDTPDGANEFGPYDLECEGDEATLTEVRSCMKHRPVDAVPNKSNSRRL